MATTQLENAERGAPEPGVARSVEEGATGEKPPVGKRLAPSVRRRPPDAWWKSKWFVALLGVSLPALQFLLSSWDSRNRLQVELEKQERERELSAVSIAYERNQERVRYVRTQTQLIAQRFAEADTLQKRLALVRLIESLSYSDEEEKRLHESLLVDLRERIKQDLSEADPKASLRSAASSAIERPRVPRPAATLTEDPAQICFAGLNVERPFPFQGSAFQVRAQAHRATEEQCRAFAREQCKEPNCAFRFGVGRWTELQ